MREFKVKRLLITFAVIAGVIAFIFLPYYVGFWCGYRGTPDIPTAIPSPTDNETIYYARLISHTTPVDVWLQGFLRIIAAALGLAALVVICTLLYSLYDWVFPIKSEYH